MKIHEDIAMCKEVYPIEMTERIRRYHCNYIDLPCVLNLYMYIFVLTHVYNESDKADDHSLTLHLHRIRDTNECF